LEKVFSLEEYTVLRSKFRKMCEEDNRLSEYCKERNINYKEVTEKEKNYLKQHERMPARLFK
jgi:hypothetical protein